MDFGPLATTIIYIKPWHVMVKLNKHSSKVKNSLNNLDKRQIPSNLYEYFLHFSDL